MQAWEEVWVVISSRKIHHDISFASSPCRVLGVHHSVPSTSQLPPSRVSVLTGSLAGLVDLAFVSPWLCYLEAGRLF